MTDKWGSLTRKIPTEPEEEELDERDMFDLTAKLKLGEGLGRLTFDGGGLDLDQGEVYSYGQFLPVALFESLFESCRRKFSNVTSDLHRSERINVRRLCRFLISYVQ